MDIVKPFTPPCEVRDAFRKKVAYFCMEFGIDHPLRIYSGGLGYLAGSHMRSAWTLGQNLIGIGILWKYGYYEQQWNDQNEMQAVFRERFYNFLEDTGIRFRIEVNNHPVWVKACYLPPEVFGTAPIFLLSTDVPENDYLARTICHRLYDDNVETKIAQYILLGRGGARLLEEIGFDAEVYHLNEAHGLPAAFYLFEKLQSASALRQRLVFTTHTPVPAGNESHDMSLLERMGFFGGLRRERVVQLTGIDGPSFNLSLAALRMARIANGVSKLHGQVARDMWRDHGGICPIVHVTNAQDFDYWHDRPLYEALERQDEEAIEQRKREMKAQLFQIVADQTGKLFDPDVCTIVWARRFAGYKRADLITRNWGAFVELVRNRERPVQIIWAGKPYPKDYGAIATFNRLAHMAAQFPNVAILTGYEMNLSMALKKGADIWLNNPRVTREASGTSGMTAAMNGAINCSTWDGWIPEFARDGHNAFVVPPADPGQPLEKIDEQDRSNLMRIINHRILPTYYEDRTRWAAIRANSMREIIPFFDSKRMAREYYEKIYTETAKPSSWVPVSLEADRGAN